MVFKWTGSHLGRDGRKGAGLSVLVVAVGGICVAAGAARAQTCPTAACTTDAQCHEQPIDKFCTHDFCLGNVCFCLPNDCSDGLFCTDDVCNESTDTCTHTAHVCQAPTPYCSEALDSCAQCLQDSQCTTSPRLTCDTSSGTCVQCLSDFQCSDGLFCDGVESCNSSTGLCQAGTPPSCTKKCFRGTSPGAICTTDAGCGAGGKCLGFCSELRATCVQCDHDAGYANGGCDDGAYCNGPEACQSDNCVAGAAPNCRRCVGGIDDTAGCATNADCASPGTCTGSASYCDEANDRCQVCLTDAHCDDGLFCTSDDCTQLGNPPNALKVCNNQRDPDRFCDNGLVCDGRENCSADNTSCVPGTPLVCQKHCFLGTAPPGTVCTSAANCGTGGKCLGFCNDDPFHGCVQCLNNATCDDLLFCNGTETCGPTGQCVAGTAPDCTSFGTPPCSVGTCNESQDRCVAQAQNNGAQCEDADHCTASSKCSGGLCVNNVPAANDPYRCVRLEWRPTTPQTLKVGSTITLSLYAVADQCNTASDDCPTNQASISQIETLLSWTPTVLELRASTSQNLNPLDTCNNSSACTQCQTCTGGSNPGASCTQQCVGGTNHAQTCFNSTQCPGGQCYSGPVCLSGTSNGNSCATNGNCPGGTCNMTGKCLGGGTCSVPTAYNWDSSVFPNDCVSSQMNGPCPSLGFPGNDGDLYYQSSQPLSCVIPGATGFPPPVVAAHPACVPSTGLNVTNIKFKAISNPGGPTGTNTSVTLLPCGPNPRRTTVLGHDLPPPNYYTDDLLKSLGPPASIRVVACDVNVDCDDGDGCTLDVCTANHACSHTPLNCEDPNPCTVDACVEVCSNNASRQCGSDGDCTLGGVCTVGVCTHTPVVCGTGEVCYLGDCYKPCSTVAECDDGVACTGDTCDTTPPPPIDGICHNTPNDALCDTGLFCSAKVCDAELGCVFDHECFGSNGNPCPSAATCNEATNTCGGCNQPTAVAGGCRYLLVTPAAQGSTPIALKVIGECHDTQSACVAQYVQSKCNGGANNGANCLTDADCPKRCTSGTNIGNPCVTNGDCPLGTANACAGKCDAGTLGSTPFYKTASQWGTAKVRGAQIRPSADYFVETQCNFPGVVLSAAASARTWKWGDVDNSGIVDAIDIALLVDAFRGIFRGHPFEQFSLWPCTPDDIIDALDIAKDVDAFRGYAFPCGITCP